MDASFLNHDWENTTDINHVVSNLTKDLEIDINLLSSHLKTASLNISYSFEDHLQNLIGRCRDNIYIHPHWNLLSGRLSSYCIIRKTPKEFSEATKQLHSLGFLNESYAKFALSNAKYLDSIIDKTRDYVFDLFAISTLEGSYLITRKNKHGDIEQIFERPQYMYLRVAIYLFHLSSSKLEEALINIKNHYDYLSTGQISQATPTLFNAGKKKSQMASCFLLEVPDDTVGIADSWKYAALFSKECGGVGEGFSQLRHSEIGLNGFSNGVVGWLQIVSKIFETINQGGKRAGNGTIYLDIIHVDIKTFILARDPQVAEAIRAKNLFYGIMMRDLFMKRMLEDGMWSLFCPNQARDLFLTYGEKFEELYIKYEKEKKYTTQIRARELWEYILFHIAKLNMPFILSLDAINRKSNHNHLGTIRLSNLCTEIAQYTDKDTITSCNLMSISIVKCVIYDKISKKYKFDYDLLEKNMRQCVRTGNNLINHNYYPEEIPQLKTANFFQRNLGIGVNGFADAIAKLDLSWVLPGGNNSSRLIMNPKVREFNKNVYEVMYYAAISETIELAKINGPCGAFKDSPASKGLLQFDLWNLEAQECSHIQLSEEDNQFYSTSRYTKEQWDKLREDSKKYGWYNSLLIAQMPTASTAQILGHSESNEPFSSLIYSRTVLSGSYVIVNKHLVEDLIKYNLWTTSTVQQIIKNQGSIASLTIENASPDINFQLRRLKLKYKTAYEIPHMVINQLATDRGRFICQTQSLNCHLGSLQTELNSSNDSLRELPEGQRSLAVSSDLSIEEKDKIIASQVATRLHQQYMDCYHKGQKTWSYYVSQQVKINPINFSVDSIVIPTVKQGGQVNGHSQNGIKRKTFSSDEPNSSLHINENHKDTTFDNHSVGDYPFANNAELCLSCAT